MKRILLFGDVMLDEWILTSHTRLSPETNVPILRVDQVFRELGGVGNALRHCINIDPMSEMTLLTATGNDVAGQEIVQLISKLKLSQSLILGDVRHTTVKSRIFQGEKPLYRIDREDPVKISLGIEQSLVSYIMENLHTNHSILISDYGKGVVTKKIVTTIAKIARELEILSVMDVYPPTLFWVEDIDVVKPNELAWSAYIRTFSSEDEAIEDLLVRRRVKSLLITRGARGMTYIDDFSHQNFASEQSPAVDVTGAGDSIAAGIAIWANKNSDLPDLIPSLMRLGAKTVEMPRTQLPEIRN